VDGAVHCDDGTLPSDWPLVRFCDLMVEAFAKLGTRSHAAMFGGNYLHEAGFVNIQHHAAKLPYGTWPADKLVSLSRQPVWGYVDGSSPPGANFMLNRTTRLVGLYYRTAAEDFFPAMGALQMPLLGWSKVRYPEADMNRTPSSDQAPDFRKKWKCFLLNAGAVCGMRACTHMVLCTSGARRNPRAAEDRWRLLRSHRRDMCAILYRA